MLLFSIHNYLPKTLGLKQSNSLAERTQNDMDQNEVNRD